MKVKLAHPYGDHNTGEVIEVDAVTARTMRFDGIADRSYTDERQRQSSAGRRTARASNQGENE